MLANIYLHYAFDAWMAREFPAVPFERYAGDLVVHSKSERQARLVLGGIETADGGLSSGATARRKTPHRVLQGFEPQGLSRA